ncbi:MAG TPA: YtxH domain-containing protein [Bryobacteraceae bacterium]|nr:YtxH domain-containing protein [Bryobacteraceae bacterium]
MSETQQEASENTQNEWTNRLAWFLTGAVIGVTAAMLYAPKPGKETRQFIADKTQQGCDAVSETSKDIVEAGKEMFERGRKLVEDAADLFERGRKLVRG